MKYYTTILFISLFFIGSQFCQGQFYISGIVSDDKGEVIPNVNVIIKGTSKGTSTNFDGNFTLKLPKGTSILVFTGIGLEIKKLKVDSSFSSKKLKIRLKYSSIQLNEIEIITESKSSKIEKVGFNVEAVEINKIKSQSLELNKILDRTPGVRVRTTGGVGSDFEYSLDGMSGNAIRFFIDGIPMDYYGASYSIIIYQYHLSIV